MESAADESEEHFSDEERVHLALKISEASDGTYFLLPSIDESSFGRFHRAKV
jgi:hypothetical protein